MLDKPDIMRYNLGITTNGGNITMGTIYNKAELKTKPHIQMAENLFNFLLDELGTESGCGMTYEIYRTILRKMEGKKEWTKELDEFAYWLYHLEESFGDEDW